MRFTIEDGTGITLANAFVTTIFVDEYADEMGNTVWGTGNDAYGNPLDDEALAIAKMKAIIQASRWLSSAYIWKGVPSFITQGLAFPRDLITETSVLEFPEVIREAAASAALRAYAGIRLTKDEARGGLIQSAKVGPVAVTYADNAPAGKLFTDIENMIRPYARGLSGSSFITTSVRMG